MDKKYISDIVLRFINRYENINTQESYLNDLSLFVKFMVNKKIDSFKIDYPIAEGYANLLKTKNYSRASFSRKLIVVRKFYNFIRGLGIIDQNPFEALRIPSVDKTSKTKNIDDNIIKEILRLVENNKRNKLIIYFLVFHGLRVTEVASIKIENLNLDEETPYVLIEGKRDKKRKQAILPDMVKVIKDYIDSEECNDYLFPGNGVNHIHRQTIWNLIKYLSKILGVNLHPHQFRHYAITKALNSGMTIQQVKDYAGHGDINTTDRYDRTIRNLKDSPVLKISENLKDPNN